MPERQLDRGRLRERRKADDELDDILAALILPAPEVRVVLTHQDADHFNHLVDALEEAAEDDKLKAVYVGGPRTWLPDPPPEGRKTPTEKLTDWLDEYGATYPAPTFDGSALACGDDVSIEVLIAGHDTKPGKPFNRKDGVRKNNASIVLDLERDGFGIILAGDAYEAAEKAILATGADIEAEVLKLGHHGAADSSGTDWIKAIQPNHVIATAGQNGTYGHPRCEVLDRFKSHAIASAPVHPVECFVARGKPWEHRDLSVSVWNACETGHLRLTVGDAAQYTLEPHTFPQDKVGNGPGEKCPVRFEK